MTQNNDSTPTRDDHRFVHAESLPPITTVQEIARFLRVAPNTVYGMIRRNEIPGARRVGRTVRFSTQTVLAWLSQREGQKN